MLMIDAQRNPLAAASPVTPWIAIAAITTIVTFFIATAARDAVEAGAGATAPEKLWTYDAAYLRDFAAKTEAATVWGSPALTLYWKFVLPVDIVFALSLAALTVLFWLSVAALSVAAGWLCAAIVAGAMGLLYGFADVAEDLQLIAILRDPGPAIGPGRAAAANWLTRLKLVTNLLSIAGFAVFAVLWAINRITPGLFGLFTRLAQLLWRRRT